MFWSLLWFLVTILLWEICLSSIRLLVCARVICLWGFYLFLPIFVFCVVPQGFFPSLATDTHILCLVSIVSFAFDHFIS
jgi:hypothetical protein